MIMNWNRHGQMTAIPEPIIIREIMDTFDNDKELLLECFGDFQQTSHEMIKDIESAVIEENAVNLAGAAHRFKGTLIYLAAKSASDIAYKLEMMGIIGDMGKADDTFKAFVEECDRVRAFIDAYLNR